MNWLLRLSLLVLLHCSPGWVFCQDTFQKLFPTLQPTWGDCTRRSHTGGLIFSSGTQAQVGSSFPDIALLSFDNRGDTLWTKVYRRPFNAGCFHLLPTSEGGYLLTGYTKTDPTDSYVTSIYLIRTDGMGDTLWTRAYGSGGYNVGFNAVECSDGGFLVVGSWDGWYFDGLYMLRIDPLGDLIWAKHYDHMVEVGFMEWASSVNVQCIIEAENGDFFVSGGRAGYPGVFLARLNADGEVIWSRRTYDVGNIDQLEPTPDGGLIISGSYDSDPLLIRSDLDGNPVWSKAYSGVSYGGTIASTRTSDDGMAFVAQTADTDPGSSNTYFLKTDPEGEVVFSRMFGGTSWDAARGVVQADDGGYFIVAWSQSFGFNTAMYVIKTDSVGNSGCYEYDDTAVAVDVQIAWDTLELESLSSVTDQYPSACSIRSGVSVLSLCSVGVEEYSANAPPITVFPNPTSDGFTVSVPSGYTPAQIEIINSLGERVYETLMAGSEKWIDRAPFTSGVYLVKVTAGRSPVFLKVVLD